MTKQDVKFMAVVLFVAAALIFMGFAWGYTHVICRSEAYCVDHGDTLIMMVDGHVYQYVVSPEFYDRVALRCYDAPYAR